MPPEIKPSHAVRIHAIFSLMSLMGKTLTIPSLTGQQIFIDFIFSYQDSSCIRTVAQKLYVGSANLTIMYYTDCKYHVKHCTLGFASLRAIQRWWVRIYRLPSCECIPVKLADFSWLQTFETALFSSFWATKLLHTSAHL